MHRRLPTRPGGGATDRHFQPDCFSQAEQLLGAVDIGDATQWERARNGLASRLLRKQLTLNSSSLFSSAKHETTPSFVAFAARGYKPEATILPPHWRIKVVNECSVK